VAQSAYARAYDNSHINVTATNKMYAAALNNGSIYFFGSPNLMSQFLSGNGTVIPVWNDTPQSYPICRIAAQPARVYKDQAECQTQYRYRAPVHKKYVTTKSSSSSWATRHQHAY
jgi:hypothetical protein